MSEYSINVWPAKSLIRGIPMNRKESILKSAVQLFAERGFASTPTSAIAKKAGVAEGLIFHHFKNKEGILVHILMDLVQAHLAEGDKLLERTSTGMEALEAVLRHHFRISRQRSTEVAVLVRDFPLDLINRQSSTGQILREILTGLLDQMKRCIQQGIVDGSIRKVPVDDTADIIRGMLTGVTRLPIDMPEVHQEKDLENEVVCFCRRSLGIG